MSINNYIEKLRAKPARERERIAVVATGVAFAIIFVIWLVSFSEMNKNSADQSDAEATSVQFDDLKSDIGQSKQSIQDMLQQMPSQQELNDALQSSDQLGTEADGAGGDMDNGNTDTQGAPPAQDLQVPNSGTSQTPDTPSGESDNSGAGEIPALP